MKGAGSWRQNFIAELAGLLVMVKGLRTPIEPDFEAMTGG